MRIAIVVVALLLNVQSANAGDPKPVDAERMIHMTAKKFEYSPSTIDLEQGVPVIIEIRSLDRKHGFKVPALNLRSDVKPGETVRVHLVPDKVGTFPFHCDVFCGSGHEGMEGKIVVHPHGWKPTG